MELNSELERLQKYQPIEAEYKKALNEAIESSRG